MACGVVQFVKSTTPPHFRYSLRWVDGATHHPEVHKTRFVLYGPGHSEAASQEEGLWVQYQRWFLHRTLYAMISNQRECTIHRTSAFFSQNSLLLTIFDRILVYWHCLSLRLSVT